ncbi:uncharacterized protein LOC128174514 [Crassostrea angulata]|uniref:uncharacterized protein LOC128174514 n=1 Tax=Magallana angulata TaxID=2784310 RepID=UPI0022B0EF4B|nr:uncharacterized protein LOC128174514 [Crassostrea angulata]
MFLTNICINICIALWFAFSSAYDNLALNKPAHEEYPYNAFNTDASNAVDGLKTDLFGLGGQCSMSAPNKRTSTWWVNLTSISSIHDIRIYYRTDNVHWNATNGYTSRFLGFSIYVSNTTNKSEGKLCYKDTNFTPSTIPAVFNTTCFVHGQYVIYYNERLPGVTYPSGYSDYAFNDLCEVEVYGCPTPGYYGINCTIPCPDANCGYCHIETGTCQGGCKPGYKGHKCELECDGNLYGENCSKSCGNCKNNQQCHYINGSCMNGCENGYQGLRCDKECDNGTYGNGCNKTCGHCVNKSLCNHVNGTCFEGCDPGYRGSRCRQKCTIYKYGDGCQTNCGHCFNMSQCHHINGTCFDGCDPGYEGQKCNQECQNRSYGYRCQRKCGHCLNSSQCDNVNGGCLQGCEQGYGGRTCNLVNLALHKPAYEENIYSHANVNAGNAVDGRKSNLRGSGGECSISNNRKRTATWWVNLESIYSIHNIRIYHRTENLPWGQSNGHTARSLGFSLYVSNTTDKSDGKLCYKDKNFTKSTIPAVFNTICFVHGQYVIYYNERLPGVTYPSGYSDYAYNELCEVEVYGKHVVPDPDTMVLTVTSPVLTTVDTVTSRRAPVRDVNLDTRDTSVNWNVIQDGMETDAKDNADISARKDTLVKTVLGNVLLTVTAVIKNLDFVILGVIRDGKGHIVQKVCIVIIHQVIRIFKQCDGGLFGANCSTPCGHCLNNQQCHHIFGTCGKRCDPGYMGDNCTEECDDYKFGENCSFTCGNCENNEKCYHIDGTCTNGCDKGYQGPKCDTECDGHTYGYNCQEHCGICRNGEECDTVTGVCPNGCDTGYTGDNCKETCSNKTYGLLCSLTCGNCIDKQQCHHVTGKCPEGCAVGFQGERCDKALCLPPSAESADHPSISYILSALLTVCVIVIIFLTLRLCKHEQCCKCHQHKQPKDDKPVDTAPAATGHDVNVDDGTAYQELNEVTNQPQRSDLGHTAVNPDCYVNVEGDNSAYQALGDVTQPSIYDTPFQK